MPRRARWKELILGIVALAVITGVALAVLVFARVGTLHGSTFRLFALAGEARGLIRGSEVWLSGQKVGVVKGVAFLPPNEAVKSRLIIMMDILSSAREEIRLNSTAQIRAGGTLIGTPVVYLSIGSSVARAVKAGDTLHALPQSDFETISSQLAIASRQFPEIIDNIKLLDSQLNSVHGTLGAFGIEHGGVELTRARLQSVRFAGSLTRPTGTIGLALNSRPALAERAQRLMARADSVRALLASDKTSYGRFRRDSALVREVADIRNEVDIVRARMASPNGTLGRARADSALFDALAGVQREMTLIMADMHRRPLRYIHF
jgi:phospholipid/cholesterol/gamma-HCH transport system substrate-binding protein